jgi:hypothetical protein
VEEGGSIELLTRQTPVTTAFQAAQGANPSTFHKYRMRQWMNLFEHSHEAPLFFYHGTNIVAAASILSSNCINASEQDEHRDGNHHSISLTTNAKLGRDFAVEYVRWNTLSVGAVFKLAARKLMQDHECIPFEAETAGQYEFEYRLWGDIRPLSKYLLGVQIVGDLSTLYDEHDPDPTELDRPLMMAFYDRFGKHNFRDVDDMEEAIRDTLTKFPHE